MADESFAEELFQSVVEEIKLFVRESDNWPYERWLVVLEIEYRSAVPVNKGDHKVVLL